MKASDARDRLYRLLDEAADEPILITGPRSNAVLVGEADWRFIQQEWKRHARRVIVNSFCCGMLVTERPLFGNAQ